MGKGKLKEVSFTPKTDLNEYLQDEKNYSIFMELLESEEGKEWENPLEFFNTLYALFQKILENKETPLLVNEYLDDLEVIPSKKWILFDSLCTLINEKIELKLSGSKSNLDPEELRDLNICMLFIDRKTDALLSKYTARIKRKDKQLKKNALEFKKNLFEFVKDEVNKLPNDKAKVEYLENQKTIHKQFMLQHDHLSDHLETAGFASLIQWFDLEIEKLERELALEGALPEISQGSGFKFEGSKIDLIRILNAMYDSRLISEDGKLPTKGLFMEKAGEFFGFDLSNYDVSLSQSLGEGSLKNNLKIFEKLIETTEKSHSDRNM